MEERSKGQMITVVCRFIIHLAVHKMIGVVVYQVIRVAVTTDTIRVFDCHIILSVIGYQLLMIEAVMTFNKESSWIRNLPRKYVKLVHLTLGVLGGSLSFVGGVLIMVDRGGVFSSAHGICGLIALLFSVICLFNGTLTYFGLQLRDKIKPATTKAVHTTCGMIALIMGLTTLCLGINKNIFLDRSGGQVEVVSMLTSFVVMILVYCLWHPLVSMVGYIQNMRSTEL